MSDKIMGRPIKSGDINESQWPPRNVAAKKGFYVYRYKDLYGHLHKTRQNLTDQLVSINIEEDTTPVEAAPIVITDEMPPIQSMATFDAPTFTSKSAYRRHLKEYGYRETGGEHRKDANRPESAADREAKARRNHEITVQAIMDVKYDRVEFSEKEKETFKREERLWGRGYKIKSPY